MSGSGLVAGGGVLVRKDERDQKAWGVKEAIGIEKPEKKVAEEKVVKYLTTF